MNKNQNGFTIIELMIAVAIIGILAAIAVPAYSDYINRAKISEGLQLASTAKTSVSEYAITQGILPKDNESVNLANNITANYVQSINVYDGIILITYKSTLPSGLADKSILLVPTITDGTISWVCRAPKASDTALAGIKPLPVAVDNKFLPSSCR